MNLGVLQAKAEKLNNEELKAFKEEHKLTGDNWERVKIHVRGCRKLRRRK